MDSNNSEATSEIVEKDGSKDESNKNIDQKNTKSEKGREFKLRRFYYLAELSGEISLFFFSVILYVFRSYFPWVTHPVFNFWLCMTAFVLHASCFSLREITKKPIFFTLARYVFLIFFCIFIFTTGGSASPFVFLIMFPLLVSTADLDGKSTKIIGYIVVSFLTAMFITDLFTVHSLVLNIIYGIQLTLYILIATYLYDIVTETLHQKYEKEEVNRKLLKAVELDRMKTVFVTIAQHQLRTPLSGVRWALDNILKEGRIPAETVPLLQESYTKINESIGIVGEMLKTAESDIEDFNQNKKIRINLAILLDTIIKKLEYLSTNSQVRVVLEKDESESADSYIVSGDIETLEPALTNIIDNAIRYSPRGTVHILIADEKSQVKVQISDNGIGIDSVDQENIFERFYRGKNAIAIDPNESGIGLYSTKNIIELHGGTITFTSAIGKGSVFTVALPK